MNWKQKILLMILQYSIRLLENPYNHVQQFFHSPGRINNKQQKIIISGDADWLSNSELKTRRTV